MYKEIYQNKKVLITGHTGFKGSWLLSWLHGAGSVIKGYALPPKPEHKLFDAIDGSSLCESVYNDIRNYKALENEVLRFDPDFIFHLAAQPIVRTSYSNPIETFEVNAIGTANLLDIVRKLPKRCIIVVITTDKVYLNREWDYPYRETDRLGGHDPYSASKACAELIVASFRNSYFDHNSFPKHKKSIAVARAGNVLGGGDWANDRILPDCIRALKDNQKIVLRNPDSIRPWQHVLDSVNAYLLLGCKLSQNSNALDTEFNFGPDQQDCWTVKRMVEEVIKTWGHGSFAFQPDKSDLHEASLLKLDTSRAKSQLNWQPVWSASMAIRRTVQWYKSFDRSNALDLVKKDIEYFLEQNRVGYQLVNV